MKNKNKLFVGLVILAIILLFLVLIRYTLKENIAVSSSSETTDVSEGMEVTLLGGTNMEINGAENSMRIYY